MDSNHDIVPTLRMFDGLMMNKAADEIERLRALLDVKSAIPTSVVLDDERVQPTFKEFRASLARLNDANTPLSIADRVMILSNATFLLDEYRAALPQPVVQTNRAAFDEAALICEAEAKQHKPSCDDYSHQACLDCAEAIRARAVARPVVQTERALTDEQREDLQEAREILENMVRSVELGGNYSTEATCTFLRQALQCLPASQPAIGGDHG